MEVAAAARADAELTAALRAGDERAFMRLVEQLGPPMLRVAMLFVSSRAVAEEVVQEAWLGVLTGIERFEGRSSLKTWIFRILTNTAKTRGQREGRSVPFSSLGDASDDEPSVDPDLFFSDGRWAGHWMSAPQRWDAVPEHRLVADETVDVVRRAIAGLPASQQTVISLRDVEGWGAEEVCDVLEISEANQRVLLHRARARVRKALDEYLGEGATTS